MADMKEIEAYFKANPPGEKPFKMDRATVIINPRAFVDSNLFLLKAAAGKTNDEKRALKPYFDRLEKFYNLKTNN